MAQYFKPSGEDCLQDCEQFLRILQNDEGVDYAIRDHARELIELYFPVPVRIDAGPAE